MLLGMAALNREAIYVALEQLLAAIPGVKTCSRVTRDLGRVAPTEQPAVFLSAHKESAKNTKGLPTVWTLRATVLIYARTDPETGNAPSSVLNPILTALENALLWVNGDGAPLAPQSPTTLKGLVSRVWMGPEIDIGEGVETGQGVAIVPLEILATGGA
jgi:hypothetical protein